jgi:hypothetical protein
MYAMDVPLSTRKRMQIERIFMVARIGREALLVGVR